MSSPSRARRVHQIPIHMASARPPANERHESCKISSDIAAELGLSVGDTAGQPSRVRISVTAEDVNTLYNPDYADYLGREAVFEVDEILAGYQRVEIYANSGPGATDGGVFRLYASPGNPFAGVCIPENARVTVCQAENVPSAHGAGLTHCFFASRVDRARLVGQTG